jgi:Protein of unknown function (DUF2281)
MNEQSLLEKIRALPDNKKIEVEDFTDFLLQKTMKGENKITPEFGFAKGAFAIKPGFDDPVEGMEEYMQS